MNIEDLQLLPKEFSRYEPLAKKEFKSTIPTHLLTNLSDEHKFIVEAVSKLESEFNWTSESLLKINTVIIDYDARLLRLEAVCREIDNKLTLVKSHDDKIDKLWDWKQFFSGKWAVLSVLALMLLPILFKVLIEYLVKLLKI